MIETTTTSRAARRTVARRGRRASGAAVALALAVTVAVGCDSGDGSGDGTTSALAPAPAELERLGLTRRMPREIREACREAADIQPLPVRCPPIVPRGRTEIELVNSLDSLDPRARRSYVVSAASTGLGGLEPRGPDRGERGHWIFAAGSARAIDVSLLDSFDVDADDGGDRYGGRFDPVRTREATLGGRDVTLLWMRGFRGGGGFHAGHAVVRWTQEGVDYLVSIHGYEQLDRAKVIALGLMEQIEDSAAE